MRLAFAGTPEFARVALAALHAAGFEVALVLTQPDRPAGRGLKLLPSAGYDYWNFWNYTITGLYFRNWILAVFYLRNESQE